MNDFSNSSSENSQIERQASDWALRIDRGLVGSEQDEYSDWLASDPRHKKAMALYQWGWGEFDRLAGLQSVCRSEIDPDLLAPGNRFARRPPITKYVYAALALAASVAIAWAIFWGPTRANDDTLFASHEAVELISRIEQRTLDDGSTIELNRGAVLKTEYTSKVRRVWLERGEASFDVAKDPSRPFVVNVAGVDVQAVGTQFNVRLTEKAVDVIVSEGVVKVSPKRSGDEAGLASEESFLEVGQRGVLHFDEESKLDVSELSPSELARELGWKPRLLDFDAAPMSDIVEAFNRANVVKLSLENDALAKLRLSASIWSDNVEGFVRLMENNFEVKAEWRGDGEILLRKARSESR